MLPSFQSETEISGSNELDNENREDSSAVSLWDVATLVAWVGCLIVGTAGLLLHYIRPLPAAKSPPPIEAEFLNVELTSDPLPTSDVPPPPPSSLKTPPPLPPEPLKVAALSLVPVAAPDAAVAFPVPVEGPVQIVPAQDASPARPVENKPATDASPAPPVQPLTYGVGEGRQPAPEYPRAAERAGQEGTVRVRFTVGENGRVLATDASSPSPWSLLNESALRVIRERWRFRPGAVRLYEVSIRFELRK
ncbi:MAG TPA: energy transducer TonB [Verrucomicrobiae bacterium]|nr:energy transducer TonB [Verrucomicrobiae bacterium]